MHNLISAREQQQPPSALRSVPSTFILHCVPIKVTPKLKSTYVEHNSTEPYIILTQLINVYLTSAVQILAKYTA